MVFCLNTCVKIEKNNWLFVKQLNTFLGLDLNRYQSGKYGKGDTITAEAVVRAELLKQI